jgi:hypothetical protein
MSELRASQADLAAVRAQLEECIFAPEDCDRWRRELIEARAALTALRAERDNYAELLKESKHQFVVMQKRALDELSEARARLALHPQAQEKV